jgi:hypothetical protein
VYITDFYLYLGHHQENSIKNKLEFSNPNMDPYYTIFVVVIISEYTLKSIGIEEG